MRHIKEDINLKEEFKSPRVLPKTKVGNQAYKNISLEIVAAKRKAKPKWHRTHAPIDKAAVNKASKRLKVKLKKNGKYHSKTTS